MSQRQTKVEVEAEEVDRIGLRRKTRWSLELFDPVTDQSQPLEPALMPRTLPGMRQLAKRFNQLAEQEANVYRLLRLCRVSSP